ncbi:MAG: hypothetical protein J0G96_07295 [Flavobacteriia bacterium]|nr:hypothetical protein [Flavobacteriia bacterium]OJX36671.1 MAG: hypothetical protein BGO87_12805 [Flavobacteriia bacterium 40-80]
MTDFSTYFAIEKTLQAQGYDVDRTEVIQQFTDGRKSGLRELSSAEYSALIIWLNKSFTSAGARASGKQHAVDQLTKQRRKIIALLCKIGYVKNDKADMPRIYSWVLSHGYLHKPFNQYSLNEIPRLVTQAEKFYKSHIDRI